MDVTILLFGKEAEAVGSPRAVVSLPAEEVSCRDLREALAIAQPKLASQLAASRFAINHAFATDDQRIRPTDEIALIGMVSGG